MERWHNLKKDIVEAKEVDAFLSEIHEVCKKHRMGIAHEDMQGCFIIESYDDYLFDWLNHASIGASIK